MISDRGLWQTLFLDGHVYLWFPLIIWLVVGLISVILLFPRLTRHIPLVWLDMGYYRGLTLQGCACMLRINPRAADVCRAVAEALPIPLWSARLRLAASAIDAGMPAPQALNQQRILHADEARVLALGRTPQAWAWTLEEIARTQRERSMARLDLGSQIASVLIVLISGGLIAVLAVALLGSLTNWVLHVVP
jgi:hypothetical protein